jgi:tripartite-type tricarboxylate transporter receptor subunit TctC
VVMRLNAEANRALKSADVRERFAKQGLEVGGGTPEEMARRSRADYERYVRIIKATGMKPE